MRHAIFVDTRPDPIPYTPQARLYITDRITDADYYPLPEKDMKERELQMVLEHKDAPMDWPVVVYYEWEGGVQVNGVWDVDGDTDYWGTLTKDQEDAVMQECIDDYAGLCDAAEAAAEDYGDWLYEDRKARIHG